MEDIIYIVGLLLSSLVSVSIAFDFMNRMLERRYKNNMIYLAAKIIFIIILTVSNTFNNGVVNFLTSVIAAGYIGIKLYRGNKKIIVLYNMCLIISIGACEFVGIAVIHFILSICDISIISEKMSGFFDITANQIIVIFLYHLVLLQILRKKDIKDLTYKQYFFALLYALFSLINLYSLYILLSKSTTERDLILIIITFVGIVFININFMNILQFTSEINQLQYENNLFLEQSKMQYRYYDFLEKQHRESLSMLHDVKRHIWAIEELYKNKEHEKAAEYTENLSNIMHSLDMNEFTDNRMLNIILNDKMRLAKQNNIDFTCVIDNINLNFMENIDLTTIFSNLLDNSIDACTKINGDRIINIHAGSFNNLVFITIKNSMKDIPGYIGIDMASSKKNHRGHGLNNVNKVINKYNGDFNIQREGNMFVCNIVISKQGRIL